MDAKGILITFALVIIGVVAGLYAKDYIDEMSAKK
jgi:uncharacterized membrane protein